MGGGRSILETLTGRGENVYVDLHMAICLIHRFFSSTPVFLSSRDLKFCHTFSRPLSSKAPRFIYVATFCDLLTANIRSQVVSDTLPQTSAGPGSEGVTKTEVGAPRMLIDAPVVTERL